MKKYFYDFDSHGNCNEICPILNDGTHIGSVACGKCKKCSDKSEGYGYIICNQLNEYIENNDVV